MEEARMTVRAVERALDILLCFTDQMELGMTEIAERTGLHKSTVHRLLASLEGKGFVARDSATDKYKLGFRIWELSAHLSQSDDPAIILLPEMERLRDVLDETISLYIRDGAERIRIQAVQSRQSIRRVAPVGDRLPLYAGASSKILLAYADEQTLNEIIGREDWPSNPDQSEFVRQFETIRRTGYAMSIEEREVGAAAIAAPIFNRAGKLVATLSVSGPANRMTASFMKSQSPAIIESARRMGKMLK